MILGLSKILPMFRRLPSKNQAWHWKIHHESYKICPIKWSYLMAIVNCHVWLPEGIYVIYRYIIIYTPIYGDKNGWIPEKKVPTMAIGISTWRGVHGRSKLPVAGEFPIYGWFPWKASIDRWFSVGSFSCHGLISSWTMAYLKVDPGVRSFWVVFPRVLALCLPSSEWFDLFWPYGPSRTFLGSVLGYNLL